MKQYFLIVALFVAGLSFFVSVPTTYAHPGNTDASGCHTCRTNCSSWGLSYGQYHCHNSKGFTQPSTPIRSHYGTGGTGYTEPWPAYNSGSPSLYSSCPANSYKSGSSCKCTYGYVAQGGKCVSGSLYCMDTSGLMSTYDSLSGSCKCMSGYAVGSSGKCEFIKTTPSYNSLFSSFGCPLHATSKGGSCYCNAGYKLTSSKLSCVPETTTDKNKKCTASFGSKSEWNGVPGEVKCICRKGYDWSANGKSCVKK